MKTSENCIKIHTKCIVKVSRKQTERYVLKTDSINSGINFGTSFYDRFFRNLPNKELKNAAQLNKVGQALASPHWNRLALGVTAMATQPALDYFNPKVDKETAKVSALRTIAKICVCTTVGFIVRGLSYKLADKFIHGSKAEGSTLFTPSEILRETNKELRACKLKLHKNTMSTLIALGVMTFTNFLLDAPLTTLAANYLIEKHHNKKVKKEAV